MTVYDLNEDQISELKTAYFWGEETKDITPDDIMLPEQIPDDIIFNYYDCFIFTNDDFCCSVGA